MTRLLTWLLAAMVLFSAAPAAAQSSPDSDTPSAQGSADGAPPMNASPVGDGIPLAQTVPAVPARTNFPYGVLIADLSNAPRAREAGFRVMATTVSWRRTQPARAQYPFEQTDQFGRIAANDLTNIVTAAQTNGMKVGLRLIDPPDWAGGSPARVDPVALEDYAYHVVRYAHNSLAYFELFNEQNLPSEWGGPPDPVAFARLMAAVYRGVKRADPSVPVINAGPSQRTGGLGGTMEDVDWLDRFLAAGGANSIDSLGVHAYMGSFDATADPGCQPFCFGQVDEFRAVMQRYGAPQSIYITEFGVLEDTSTDLGQFNWQKVSADVRADRLVGALRTASADDPWIAGATMFNLDYATVGYIPSTSEQRWFSLLNPDKSPRQAFAAIRDARQSAALP